MYARIFPNSAQLKQQNYALSTPPTQTEIVMRTQPSGVEQRIAVTRVFSPEFTSENVYSQIAPLQCFLQGESASVIIIGREKSGKQFSFLSLIFYVLEQRNEAEILIGGFQKRCGALTEELKARVAKEAKLAQFCKIVLGGAELSILKAPSYVQQNLMFYCALLAPKVYFQTTPLLNKHFSLEQLFMKGRYQRSVCFLCSFPLAGYETPRQGAQCTLSKFLQFIESLVDKCFKEQTNRDQFDIVQNIAQIQQGFKQRYDDATTRANMLQETLDQERIRFAAELKALQEQFTQSVKQNELLSIKMFALEQENTVLREQVRGIESNYQEMCTQFSDIGSARPSLREKLQSKRIDEQTHQLSSQKQRQTASLRESDIISAKSARPRVNYKKVEDW